MKKFRRGNVKWAIGKPEVPAGGFRHNGVGYVLLDDGTVRIDGKRNGEQRILITTPEKLADILWDAMGEKDAEKVDD